MPALSPIRKGVIDDIRFRYIISGSRFSKINDSYDTEVIFAVEFIVKSPSLTLLRRSFGRMGLMYLEIVVCYRVAGSR